jgi:hypothetical protein
MSDRLTDELESFRSIWHGGYCEGDPLDPMGSSGYGQLGYMSVLHVAYLACIRPYVTSETVALEIGPGRGAWTKTMLRAHEVWAIDALPEKHNGFFDYIGHWEHVRYLQVHDFELSEVPDNYFTFMFSFGTLCHVSFDGITRYANRAFEKMRSGSHCFWMVADYAKYNRAAANVADLSPWTRALPASRRYASVRKLTSRAIELSKVQSLQPDLDVMPSPGRWYDAGVERTCEMLEKVGWVVLDADVGVNHRDPVVHFVKE